MTPELPDRGPADEQNDDPRMSGRQTALVTALHELDPDLADLYRVGLKLSNSPSMPGVAYLLAHVGRELTLGVADSVIEDGLGLTDINYGSIADDERHRKTIAQSLGLPASDRRVAMWFDVHRTFAGAAHYRRGGNPPDFDRLRLAFVRLEEILYGRVGPYFETQDELDKLISMDGPPTAQHVQRLESILLRPQQRRYFFGKLSNPAWLSLLSAAGMFRHAPERVVHEDGSWRMVPWPEGDYLMRVAAQRPAEVVDIAEAMPVSISNPVVWSILAKIGSAVPAQEGRTLAKRISRGATTRPDLISDELVAFGSHLAQAGDSAALHLVRLFLFIPNASELGDLPSHTFGTKWVFPRLGWRTLEGLLADVLPSLARQVPERTANLITSKVSRAASLMDELGLGRLAYPSARIRRSGGDDPFGLLLAGLGPLFVALAEADQELVSKLWRSTEEVAEPGRSILQYKLLVSVGPLLQEALDTFIASEKAIEPGVWARYAAEVVRTHFTSASAGARSLFRYGVLRGPGPEHVWRDLTYGNEAVESDSIRLSKERWQRRRLIWFRGAIPAELSDIAEQLGEAGTSPSVKAQELAEVGFYSEAGSWLGPDSPPAPDLARLDAAGVADVLAQAQSAEHRELGELSSLEDAARKLSYNASALVSEAWDLARGSINATMARSILEGFEDARRAEGISLPVHRVIEILGACLSIAAEPERGSEDERRYLVRVATDLLEELASGNMVGPESDELARKSIVLALDIDTVWTAPTMQMESLEGILTAALDHPAPRAVRCALQLELAIYRRGTAEGPAAEPSSEDVVSALLDDARGARSEGLRELVEVVLGQFLPQLYLLCPEWLEGHLEELLRNGATDPIRHPAWGGYLTRSSLYNDSFKNLRPWYAIAAQGPPSGSSSGRERFSITEALADHVLGAVVRGLASVGDSDALVENTFSMVPVKERGHVYWGAFRGWTDADEPPPKDLIDRLLSFWEWRLSVLSEEPDSGMVEAEANLLGWFLHTPHLPIDDQLRLGVRTSKLARGDLELHLNWDGFLRLTQSGPDSAVEIVEGFVEAQLSKRHGFISSTGIRPVLSALLQQGDSDTRGRAERLVHRLGEAGYDDLKDLLSS